MLMSTVLGYHLFITGNTIYFVNKLKIVATMHRDIYWFHFFLTAFAHFKSLCDILVILAIISNLFIIAVFVMMSVIHDLLLLQKDYNSLKAQMIPFW